MMQASKLFFVFILLVTPFFMNAQGLVGTWKWDGTSPDGNTVTSSITFKADGSFELDIAMDGNVEGKGTYKVEGDNVTIVATGAGCDNVPGTYKMVVNGDSIKPELVTDGCTNRAQGVPALLTRVK